MPLTVTYPTLTTSFTSTEVDQNFADVQTVINGGITNAEISASAAIAITKLANQYQEVWLNGRWEASPRNGWVVPVDAANITIDELKKNCLVFPLPGTDADTAWSLTDVTWTCTDCGSASGSFGMAYGALNAGGTIWVRSGAIALTSGVMTFTADDKGNTGRALQNGAISITQSSTVRDIVLYPATTGTGLLTNSYDYLAVSIALRRQIQA